MLVFDTPKCTFEDDRVKILLMSTQKRFFVVYVRVGTVAMMQLAVDIKNYKELLVISYNLNQGSYRNRK